MPPDEAAPPARAEEPAAGAGWARLSPRMLLVHPVRELARLFPALIGVTVAGSGRGDWWGPAFAGLLVVYGVARWFMTTYRVTPDRVQVRSGVFSRKTQTVTRDRLRSADVTANVLHRALGLARLEVGTGRADNDARLRLDALRTEEAARLREELLRSSPDAVTVPGTSAAGGDAAAGARAAEAGGRAVATPATELARVRPAWLAYAPFTLSGIATLAVILGFFAQFVDQLDLRDRAGGSIVAAGGALETVPVWALVVAAVVLVLLVVSVLSVAGYALAYWNFRLERDAAGTLTTTRGLLTTRVTTLAERRLRGAEISEPLLLRAVGGAATLAVAVGISRRGDAERGGALALPPAPRAEARRIAAAVAGVGEELFTGPLAADRARSLGHAVLAGHLVTRSGSLIRRRSALRTEGIIGITISRTLFQRRAGVATLIATTAAGRKAYAALDVTPETAVATARAAVPGLLDPFLDG